MAFSVLRGFFFQVHCWLLASLISSAFVFLTQGIQGFWGRVISRTMAIELMEGLVQKGWDFRHVHIIFSREIVMWNNLFMKYSHMQNRRFFVPCDLGIWWMTLKNNRAPLLCYIKLCAFQSHRWIKTGITVQKRSIRVKIAIFCPVWPWNLMDDLEEQQGIFSMLLQALCIIS